MRPSVYSFALAKPSDGKRRGKRIAKIAGIVLAIPFGIVLLAVLALHTGPAQRKIRDALAARIGERVDGSFHIGELRFALGGDLLLGDVRIADAAGHEVIVLDRLKVVPDWSALVASRGGDLVIEELSLDGLHVALREDDQGRLSHKTLFKPAPPKPPEPKAPPEERHIVVRKLHIGDVDLGIDKADGTRIAIDDLGLDGHVDAVTPGQTADIALRLAADVALHKPAQGLDVAVTGIATGVTIELDAGRGTLSVLPTRAEARISQQGFRDRSVTLDLDGVHATIAPGSLEATLTHLALGAVVLQSLELNAGIAEGGLEGEQQVQLIGLHVDAARVNELLQKELLRSDVDVETKISGPPEAVVIATTVKSDGGHIAIDGTVDARDPAQPIFDVRLALSDVDTQKLLASDRLPPTKLERLAIGLRGAGRTRESAEVDVGLHIAGVSVERGGVTYRLDDVVAEARYDGGHIALSPLVAQAYGHEIIARGWVDLTRMLVDVHLTMAGDVGQTLANLKNGGLPLRSALPRSVVVLGEETVAVDLRGSLEGMLDADVAIHDLRLAGGAVFADAHAKLWRNTRAGPDERKIELRALDGVLELRAVDLKQALALRGRTLDGLTGTVSAKLSFDEIPKAPALRYRVEARLQASDGRAIDVNRPVLVAVASGTGSKTDAALQLDVISSDGPSRFDLLKAEARIPLDIGDSHKGIAPHRPLHVALRIPDAPLRELAQFIPRRRLVDPATGKPRDIPRGNIDATITLDGTAAAPTGKIDVDVTARVHPLRKQRIKLDGSITSDARPEVRIASDIAVWLDAGESVTLEGNAGAALSRSFLLPGPRELSWWLDLDLKPLTLEEYVEARMLGLSGTAEAGIHLKGDRHSLGGRVDVDVAKLQKGDLGKLDAHLGVRIEPDKTALEVTAGVNGTGVLDLRGDVGRPGLGLLSALRDPTPGKRTIDKLGNPPLDLTLTVVEHAPKTWAFRVPALADLPGRFGGAIAIRGDAATPLAKGEIGYTAFENLRGQPGRAALLLDAGPETIAADIELGPRRGDEAPLGIHVSLPRGAIGPYLAAKKCWAATAPAGCPDDVRLPLTAAIDADGADLEDLVPKFAMEGKPVTFDGQLDWKLDGVVVLDPKPRFDAAGQPLPAVSPDSRLAGRLTLRDGTLALVGSGRHYRDATIRIRHDLNVVDIEQLSLREATQDNDQRTLALRARLDLAELRPRRVTAQLSTKDFLLFGQERVGTLDAPWAELDSRIRVEGDLRGKVKKVAVTVDALELLVPERFHKAHQSTSVHVGDLVFLEKGMQPGKLPRPAARPLPEPATPPDPDAGLDLVIDIPEPGRVLLQNLDLSPKGRLTIARRGAERRIEGKLDIVDGQLELGGRHHRIVRGALIFDAQCPAGCFDLDFARLAPPEALREVSKVSQGDTVQIRMRGPIDNRTTYLDGAGSPGTLYDLLAMHNAGRPRYHSEPDNPATTVTDYPQFDNLLLMSYLAVNVPHLLFMDKVSAWSDAYDGRGTESYGQVRHFEAEGYSDDGHFRVRASAQPRAAGASEHELSFDWLWANDAQTAVGVGISGGDRLGGGPGVFFEWSSKD